MKVFVCLFLLSPCVWFVRKPWERNSGREWLVGFNLFLLQPPEGVPFLICSFFSAAGISSSALGWCVRHKQWMSLFPRLWYSVCLVFPQNTEETILVTLPHFLVKGQTHCVVSAQLKLRRGYSLMMGEEKSHRLVCVFPLCSPWREE